jgi:hypothetical protein
MTQKEKEERIADFEDTLFYWQNVGISQFLVQAASKGYTMSQSYTPEDIAEFERYVLTEKVSHTSDKEEKLEEFVACYFYLGQLFKRNYGGQWQLSLTSEQSANFNRPVIVDYQSATEGLEFNPRQRLTALILGRLKQGLKYNLDLTAGAITKESAVKNLPLED